MGTLRWNRAGKYVMQNGGCTGVNAGGEVDRIRLDKWLWAARFFKTRSQAAQCVTGGLVHVNGERVKPARVVGLGDWLEITRERERFVVLVTGVTERRGPAAVARSLYQETPESQQAREKERETRRIEGAAPGLILSHRPGKRERRLIRRFIRGNEEQR